MERKILIFLLTRRASRVKLKWEKKFPTKPLTCLIMANNRLAPASDSDISALLLGNQESFALVENPDGSFDIRDIPPSVEAMAREIEGDTW